MQAPTSVESAMYHTGHLVAFRCYQSALGVYHPSISLEYEVLVPIVNLRKVRQK